MNVLGEALRGPRADAGARFVEWATSGGQKLVVSRELLREIGDVGAKVWLQQGVAAKRVLQVPNEVVDQLAKELRLAGDCVSDDEHVIALAQVSRARLLFSNDADLQQDFRDPELIKKPRGRIYSTRCGKEFTRTHRGLLSRNICAGGC